MSTSDIPKVTYLVLEGDGDLGLDAGRQISWLLGG